MCMFASPILNINANYITLSQSTENMAASSVLTSPSMLSTMNFPSTVWALQQDGSSCSPNERAALPTTENTGVYTEGSDNRSLHNSGVHLSCLSSTKIIILPCLSTT